MSSNKSKEAAYERRIRIVSKENRIAYSDTQRLNCVSCVVEGRKGSEGEGRGLCLFCWHGDNDDGSSNSSYLWWYCNMIVIYGGIVMYDSYLWWYCNV